MHTLDAVCRYALAKPGATEDHPFGNEPFVAKVGGKIFALISQGSDLQISLKCDPIDAQFLRDTYPAIKPGYHLNKRHWNTITVDESMNDDLLKRLIDDSYTLVVSKLPRAERMRLSE